MKRKFLQTLFSILLFASFQLSAQNWSLVASFPGGPKTSFAGLEDSVLFVGTGDGIWRSPDYGFTWKQLLKDELIYSVHTTNNGTLLAGATGKIYFSTDRGNSWTPVEVPTEFPVKSFASTSTGEAFFITGVLTNEDGFIGDGVFYSNGDYTAWSSRNTGINNVALHAEHIQVDRFDRVYVAIADEYTTGNGGLFISDNKGQQWQKAPLVVANLGTVKTANVYSVNITPSDTVIYAVHGIVGSFLVTLNLKKHRNDLLNATSWKTMHVGGSTTWWLSALINSIHFAANGDWYASVIGSVNSGGGFVSTNQGKIWTKSNTGLGISQTLRYEPFTFYENSHGVVMASQFLDERLYVTNRSMLDPVEIKGKVIDDRGRPQAALIVNEWQQVFANMEGEFTLTVPKGWSGSIRPLHGQHNYEPARRSYTDIQETIIDQNFVGTYTGTHGVWGVVLDASGDPVMDVKVSGFDEILYTNEYGAFVAHVPHGWSGEIHLSKGGIDISPSSVEIPNVYENVYYLKFSARAEGTVLLGGTISYWENFPVDNIVFEEFDGEIILLEEGKFVAELPVGWSGVLTPVREGYTVTPASVTITDLQEDRTDVQFQMEPAFTYTLSGRITHRENGLVGVGILGTPQSVVTNEEGEFTVEVPAGWVGTLTPDLELYVFTPESREIENVQGDRIDLNFEAVYTGTYTISGVIRDVLNQPMYGILIEGLDQNVFTNENGEFTIEVPATWTGTLTPALNQYRFEPASRTYTSLEGNLTGQNFRASVITSSEDLLTGSASLFPNPTTNGHFTLKLEDMPDQIVLRSVTGQVVRQLPSEVEQQYYIEEPGLYVLQIFTGNEMISKKLVVR